MVRLFYWYSAEDVSAGGKILYRAFYLNISIGLLYIWGRQLTSPPSLNTQLSWKQSVRLCFVFLWRMLLFPQE